MPNALAEKNGFEEKVLARDDTQKPRNREQRMYDIVVATRSVFESDGYWGFSLRSVASRVDIKLGNLQYYFRSREDLLQAMLGTYLHEMLQRAQKIVQEDAISPQSRCLEIIDMLLNEAVRGEFSRLLFQTWALAQHEAFAEDLLSEFYASYRELLLDGLMKANPALSRAEGEARASLLTAQIDGLIIFCSHGLILVEDEAAVQKITHQLVLEVIGTDADSATEFYSLDQPSSTARLTKAGAVFRTLFANDTSLEPLTQETEPEPLYYRPTAQDIKRQAKINSIVATSATIFAFEGIANFTLPRISKELGVRPSAVQHYFPTIGQLLSATIKALLSFYASRYEAMGKPDGRPPAERLLDMFEDIFFENSDTKVCRFTFEMFALAQTSDETRTLIRDLYSVTRSAYVSLVRQLDVNASDYECHIRGTLIASQMEGLMSLLYGRVANEAITGRVKATMRAVIFRIAEGKLVAQIEGRRAP